jgi:hypothetical protein
MRGGPSGEVFSSAELEGLPEPVRRYPRTAIVPGTPLAVCARLRMRGRIKAGRWLPFSAREALNPHEGFIWSTRAAGVIAGSDRYFDGAGAMDWKLAGMLTVAHADGPEVSQSAAGRACGKGSGCRQPCCPASALPGPPPMRPRHRAPPSRPGTGRDQPRPRPRGRIRSVVFDRWGDPDETKSWAWHLMNPQVRHSAMRFEAVQAWRPDLNPPGLSVPKPD